MKTFLLILISVAVLIVLIGLIRVSARVMYGEDGAKVFVKVLFMRFMVYPSGNKVKVKKVKPQSDESKKAHKGGDLPGAMELVKLTADVFGKLRKKLSVDLLSADIRIASKDPFQTAMLFGGAGAGVGMLLAILENVFIIRKKKINVNADFTLQSTQVNLDAAVSLRVCHAVMIAIFAASRFLSLSKNSAASDKPSE